MAARICPNCKRRVDERVSKGLAVCLSCGSSLDAPPRVSLSSAPPMSGPMSGQMPGQMSARSPGPPSAYGPATYGVTPVYGSAQFTPHSMPAYAPPPARVEPRKSSGAGVIIIVVVVLVAGFAMMAAGVVAFLLLRGAPASSTSTSVSTSTVTVETPDTTDSTAATNPKEHPTAHAKPLPVPTFNSHPTSTSSAGVPPFPFSLAIEKMDEATTSAEKECAFASGPFGTTVVDVTFETDGRVGTLSRKPIGGTATGSCITAKFLAIHVGAFEGSARTFSRAVTITAPSGSPSATATNRRSSRDGGR
ncbi:MAG: hypothetical protein ACRELY_22290 [Polyangiaceae bacterium]